MENAGTTRAAMLADWKLSYTSKVTRPPLDGFEVKAMVIRGVLTGIAVKRTLKKER